MRSMSCGKDSLHFDGSHGAGRVPGAETNGLLKLFGRVIEN